MKKILLTLLLFCQIDLSAVKASDAAQFQLIGSVLSVAGLLGVLLASKAYSQLKEHANAKNSLKQIIQAHGGRVLESSAYSANVRTKQISLKFPEYPTQNDLHEICINWNKFQELASQDQKIEEFLNGTCALSTCLFIGLFLIGSTIIEC